MVRFANRDHNVEWAKLIGFSAGDVREAPEFNAQGVQLRSAGNGAEADTKGSQVCSEDSEELQHGVHFHGPQRGPPETC